MENEYSVILNNVKKKFRIYHEKRNSVYEWLTSFLNKKNSVDNLEILKGISFSVKKGEMLGIIGLNGSGKTTLLKIIGKIYTPDSGTVIINGQVTPFLELGTGFNGELTARDNIIMYGVILGLTKKQISEKIESIAEFADIGMFLDTKLKNFSSGMYARLAFATAIQVNPDVLLVDEILSVGDLTFQEKSFKEFMKFKNDGKTIIFVSHSIDQVQTICDKVLWLHDGMIRSYGDPKKVIDDYKQYASSHHN